MVVAAYNTKDPAAVKRIQGICWGDIARQFLVSEDEPQSQYTANTKVMLGRVLRSHELSRPKMMNLCSMSGRCLRKSKYGI